MTSSPLVEKAEMYLQKLCIDIPSRRVGSKGNRAATGFFADTVESFGFQVDTPTFRCMDWAEEGAQLTADTASFDALVSPYSLGCHVRAPLTAISTVDELERADVAGEILLLHGDIASEPFMPKNFPFYNPAEHRKIIALLEKKQPEAIVAATSRNPEMAGAVYPFPLFEDGDFDIPSVYMTQEEGERLVNHAGERVRLEIRAHRRPAEGVNVIARKGRNPQRRVVVFAHIDAKDGTPGAVDNATGTIVLLLLAEELTDYQGERGLEIVALNGEDYYSSPGQQLYLSRNEGKFEEIVFGINLDGVGYHQGKTAYSLYNYPPTLTDVVEETFSSYEGLIEGEPWYQGDHSILLMNGVSALAMTSEHVHALLNDIVHTPKDRPEIVDAEKLVHIASALRELLLKINAKI